jgi:hypothetical protein
LRHTHLRRPTHSMFAFLANVTHMPLWNDYINSVTQVAPGVLGLGTVFDQIDRNDTWQILYN